jgi:amidophosphoribosyltransferase
VLTIPLNESYQDLQDLEDSIRGCSGGHKLEEFDTSCFSGKYVTGESIDDEYFAKLHSLRNDEAKQKRETDTNGMITPTGKKLKTQQSNDGCESVSNDKRDPMSKSVSCESLTNNTTPVGLVS